MAFSEKIKLEAKKRSAFRCCICQRPFVEVHHIIPKNLHGEDVLENAAPLCSSCHDLFGGNPEKQNQLRQMRDEWWATVAERKSKILISKEIPDYLATINEDFKNINLLKSRNSIAIYHCVFKKEGFEVAAHQLFELVVKAQQASPNLYRNLYLDIDGHRLKNKAFDKDMFELQTKFIVGFLGSFLHKFYMPLGAFTNPRRQRNDLPDKFIIFTDTLDIKMIPEDGQVAIYDSRTGKWLRSEES